MILEHRADVVRRALARAAAVASIVAWAATGLQPAAIAAETIEQPSLELAAVRDPQLGAQVAIANHYGYFKDEGLSVDHRDGRATGGRQAGD